MSSLCRLPGSASVECQPWVENTSPCFIQKRLFLYVHKELLADSTLLDKDYFKKIPTEDFLHAKYIGHFDLLTHVPNLTTYCMQASPNPLIILMPRYRARPRPWLALPVHKRSGLVAGERAPSGC